MRTFSKIIILSGMALAGWSGCAGRHMPPARVIPPGDENTQLCKEAYLQCRNECSTVKDKDTRNDCAQNCERDADSCLLQSRAPKEK